jgi:hypothetical protein
MKRKIMVSLVVLMVMGAITVYAAEPLYGWYNGYQKVKVAVNGEELRGLNTPGFIIDGKTVLPVRETAEALTSYVRWNDSTATVELIRPNVHMMVASRISTYDGENFSIQAPFGQVSKGKKLTFDVFSQVDGLLPEEIYFKIAIFDPTGEQVYSSSENNFKASYTNKGFSYPERVENFTFKQSGPYKVKFFFKPKGSQEYMIISEKTIYSN